MKKTIFLFLVLLGISLPSFAQNEGISFQGLARNAAGEVLVSQKISLRLSILLNSESGAVAYVETRQTTTNPQGIFSLVVGDSNALTKSSDFSGISWGSTPSFIKVEMDSNAGTNFLLMGISRLQAVPFAYSATKLSNAKTINGVAFDGTANITVPADAGTLTGTSLKSTVTGSSLTSVGTLTNLKVTNPIAGSITGNAATATSATTAGTATKLATARNINGVAFDGSGDINISAAVAAEQLTGTTLKSTVTGSSLTSVGTLTDLTVTNPIAGSITGNAATATIANTVTTNANLTGLVSSVGNATSIADGAITDAKIAAVAGSKVSGNILGNAANVTGTVAVANGGTGAATLTANNVLLGNGTSALQAVAPGTSGNVLTSNGTTWASTAPSGGLPTGGAAGDMLYWNGSEWVKVAAGSNNKFLVFVNNAPTWAPIIGPTDVYNPATGKVWMDRNLGATQVATSSTDAASYGDLYQWGRGTDGHEKRTSGTTTGQSSSTTPGNTFITGSDNWYNGNNPNDLWQGVSGVNNPCPTGYRIPTETEWNAERASWTNSGQNSAGAFASPLKLPMAGSRAYNLGNFGEVGSGGSYWSSTVSGTSSRYLYFISSDASLYTANRAFGFTVRCIKD